MPKTSAPPAVEAATDPDRTATPTVTPETADASGDFRRGDDPPAAEQTDTAAEAELREYRARVVLNYGPAGDEQRYEIGQRLDLTDEAAAPLLQMRAIERAGRPPDRNAL